MNISRFSPTGLQRYNPYYDAYGRPVSYATSAVDSQYENVAPSYSGNLGKRRKPKPFSVMLDIYPITDILEQNKKNTRPKQVPLDDFDIRRPLQYNRGPKFYAPVPQPVMAVPNQPMTEEEERQQMIFHLNLYPKRKNKITRYV